MKAGAVTGAGLWAGSVLGCGGSSSTTSPTTAPGASQPGASPTGSQAQIQKGGTLRSATSLDASSLDPHAGVSGGDDIYWYCMFDNLAAYDQSFASKPELSLAEKWEFPDPQTMIFTLRKGVKFHDGTPFNAQAVKVNIAHVLDPKVKSVVRANFLPVDRVDVVDDYTAKFVLNAPSSALMAMLGGRGGAMNSPAALDKYGDDYGTHPVGTGPFQLVEWVKGSYVRMKRNPDYWAKDSVGNQLPYLDEVRLNLIPDSTVSLANLQTGDVEIIGVGSKDLDTVKKNKSLGVQDFGGGIAAVLIYNITKPPMDDVNLRLALAYAVDPDAINNAVYFGDAIVAKAGMWPTGTWVYNESVPRPSYDPKKAKEYLAKAGKPNGFSMNMITYNAPSLVQQSEMIKAQAADVGINLTIDVREVGPATTAFFEQGASPVYSTAWSRRPEPDSVASGCYKSDGYYNPGKVKNDQLDALIAEGVAVYDIEERKKIYNQINEIVLSQALYVPLLYGRNHAGYNQKVQNMDIYFGGEAVGRHRQLWLKK